MSNSKLFVCYSVPLMKHLTSNGIRYEVVGLNPQTHKTFWAFMKDSNLDMHLSKWKQSNPNN